MSGSGQISPGSGSSLQERLCAQWADLLLDWACGGVEWAPRLNKDEDDLESSIPGWAQPRDQQQVDSTNLG